MPSLLITLLLSVMAGPPSDASADVPSTTVRDDSRVPGTVITHQPASTRIYLGSPGIARLPSGVYLAKCDEFGPGTTEHTSAVTRVYRSDDGGRSWALVARLEDLFWASVFVHEGAAYLLGTTHHHGRVVIRRSDDGGRTWTQARDAASGLITAEGQYHTAPGPVLGHKGRLWRAVEDASNGRQWGLRYSAQMMSAPVDADLLSRNAWTFSNMIRRDGGWLEGDFKAFLEGNAVADGGRVFNVLRVQTDSGGRERAAICEVSADGRRLTFDPESGFIDMPGGAKKFTIRRDPNKDAFWTLASVVPPAVTAGRDEGRTPAGGIRNTLALLRSGDLRTWEVRCILLHHPDVEKHGFQYPDWLFEGDDIVAAVRTAFDDGLGGAHRAHDANYLTFHRFEDFRSLTLDDSVVDAATLGYTAGAVTP